MKTFLRTSLTIALILLIAGCTLPEVTPVPSPTASNEPTSTAPAISGAATPSETPISAGALITSQNASRIQAAERTAVSNAQGIAWALDSRSISLVSQNSSGGTDQIFSDAVLAVPSLAPDRVYAAPTGTQRLAASADGKIAAILLQNNTQVDLVDTGSKTIVQTLEPGFAVNNITFSPDGKTVSVSSQDAWKVSLFDVSTGAETQVLSGFETAAPVYDAGFYGNNQSIVWHARGTLQVQSLATGELGPTFSHEDFISSFSLSPDGTLLASASMKTINGVYEPVVYLWDTASGAYLDGLVLDSAGTALAFSPDGALIAVATQSQIQVWDVATRKAAASLADSAGPIYLVAFSPDGRWLASSYADQLVLWTVAQ